MGIDDDCTSAACSAGKEILAGVHSLFDREANVGKHISSGVRSGKSACSYVILERSVKHWAISVAFILIAVSLTGIPPDPQANTICLFLLPAKTEEANEIRSIVIEDLIHEMEKSGFSIVPEQIWKAKLSQEQLSSLELLPSSAAVQAAARVDADIALIGSIRIENRDIILRIRGYEVVTGNLVFSREEREAVDIGIYNTVSSLSRELIDTLLEWAGSQPGDSSASRSATSEGGSEPDRQRSRDSTTYPTQGVLESEAPPGDDPNLSPGQQAGELAQEQLRAEPAALEQPPDRAEAKVRLTLLSYDEGAQVYLRADQRLGTIENGKLVIEVPANTQLAIETTKPGYHSNREYFEVSDQSAEFRLGPLLKETRFGFELFSTSSQFLGIGAGFRFYIVPDYIMFKADDYIYFSVDAGGDDSPSAFHNDFRIQFGSYLFSPPSRRVRFGAATGIGVILSVLGKSSSQSENSTFYDVYWDLVDLWVDYNWQKAAVFFKVETKYALGWGNCLLEPGFVAKHGPQFTIGWLLKL